MPINYKIFESHKLVFVTGIGDINIDDFLIHLAALSRDSEYRSPMKKLIDYGDANVASLTVSETHKLTDFKASLGEEFKDEICAIVVKNDLDFGMCRVHSSSIESKGIKTAVFRNRTEALKWLEVDLNLEDLDNTGKQ